MIGFFGLLTFAIVIFTSSLTWAANHPLAHVKSLSTLFVPMFLLSILSVVAFLKTAEL